MEENPFEDELVAKEWSSSVENEKGLIRDKELYPLLARWVLEAHPQLLVEIGSGQGICSMKLGEYEGNYIGIEPSVPLVNRAKELYARDKIEFISGNAYHLPLKNEVADAVFSVNVWFHLGDLQAASKEVTRILKPNGHALIITANPEKNSFWEALFFDHTKEGKKLDGKVKVPGSPLSRNILYLHELIDMTEPLTGAGLEISSITPFGFAERYKEDKLFIAIKAKKRDY